MLYVELLLGCGGRWNKDLSLKGQADWKQLVALDNNPDHRPHVVADLMQFPWPFRDSTFDEVHAYEVLEHLGQQGDYHLFFRQFEEVYRILKPGGYFFASVPNWQGPWAWGDPSHTRVIQPETLTFLSQEQYERQIGCTSMSDFRFCYSADFEVVMADIQEVKFYFVLQAR